MNNPPIPDPPASPPETAHAWYIAWRLRLNKYSLRDHKDRLPIVRWAIRKQNTYREHTLTYWAEQQPHSQQAWPQYKPRWRRGQLVEGPLYSHRSMRRAQATTRTAIILALPERRDKTGGGRPTLPPKIPPGLIRHNLHASQVLQRTAPITAAVFVGGYLSSYCK
jgi:hypothetical protein